MINNHSATLNSRSNPGPFTALRQTIVLALLVLCAVGAAPAIGQASEAPAGTVNINTADPETLQLLPRVGPAVAQRIVEYREQNGKFRQKSDLLLVRGIGDATFERLEPYVSLEGSSTLDQKVRSPRKTTNDDASDSTTEGREAGRAARR